MVIELVHIGLGNILAMSRVIAIATWGADIWKVRKHSR